MKCKNCNNELLGKFCSQCGQNSKTERINLNYLLSEIPNSIFQLNHGFFFTINQQMIIYLLLGFLFYQENILMITPLVLGIIYNFWCINQIFEGKKTITKIGLIILSYIIFIIGMIVTLFIYVGVSKTLS